MITIKSKDELKTMREAGQVVGQVLQILKDQAMPGTNILDLDKTVRSEFVKRGVAPTFLGYQDYPATVCVSVNEELVHGIPTDRVLEDGDLVSIDLGATHKGFVGDSAITFGVGEITPEAQRLIEVTRESLWQGIRAARAGERLGVVSNAIGQYIESEGYGIVREYVGHGVGRAMHEDPQVPNYGPAERGPVLKEGMALALEPMVTIGDFRTKKHQDGWTVSTLDGGLCAHFEHTIAIHEGEAEVLTLP